MNRSEDYADKERMSAVKIAIQVMMADGDIDDHEMNVLRAICT